MAFKINIAEKSGKTFHLESESQALIEKSLKDKVEGKDISEDLAGYEFEITGASDKSGFASRKDIDGTQLKKVLLNYGEGMKKRPRREGKFKQTSPKPKGLRLRKSYRGKIISDAIVQINLKVIKEGSKKLEEIFPDQCQLKEKENRKSKRAQAQSSKDVLSVKEDENTEGKEAKEKPAEETKPEEATEEKPAEEVKEEAKPEEKVEEVKEESKEEKVEEQKEAPKEEPKVEEKKE